ncbi:5' nucleotidase, NT5C type [Heliorestis convoluta]|uniref:Nucleotidase n=1 Tax=Heliorestis convoluta TaxID=356322 RepID=A0A5Q2N4P1_9FIRM|nr:hypothetical protein [Heliorestis convoluta]QGG48282.1 hypothetical protein FTV88_2184 [Heliorestis convoluta]
MIIGVDICNTIARVNEALALHFLGTYTIPESLQKQRRWDLPGLTPDFFRSPTGMIFLSQVQPYNGAAEVLSSFVRSGHKVIYITARPQETELVTRRWLKEHHFPCDEVIHSEEKGLVCIEKEVDVMIEDDPFYAQQIKEAGVSLFLVKQRYNATFPAPKMDWKMARLILPKAVGKNIKSERN